MLYRTGIGLDVHARSIAATAFIPETGEMVRKAFPHGAGRVAEWARGMPQPAGCACGSGPAGSGLKRKPGKAGVPCVAGAVSKMLGPSGDRARTDRRDAAFLARMLAVGSIVEVAMPAEAMEAARGLARAREDCRHGPMRARHLLSKFLLRKGIVYPGKAAWTKARREWLGRPGFADPCGRPAFGECLESVRSPGLRRARPDRAMEERAAGEDMAPAVSALRRVRGDTGRDRLLHRSRASNQTRHEGAGLPEDDIENGPIPGAESGDGTMMPLDRKIYISALMQLARHQFRRYPRMNQI